jgi:DNA-3-methyladenine glycosylase
VRLRRLQRSELPRDTVALARFLLGQWLVREGPGGRLSGRIVETEAYPVGDAAGHAFRGRTPRNASLFLERGFAYVYLAYGTSYLLNVSSERVGIGAGVLLRALEPAQGLSLMQRRRRTPRLLDLARGPGRLAEALAVDLRQDGLDLCGPGPLWLATRGDAPPVIASSPRIGITRAARRRLRFYVRGSPHVSGPKRLRR